MGGGLSIVQKLVRPQLNPTNDNEETVIMSIRTTGVALGLGRLPAGFYVVLYHSGREWRTDSKPSSVNDDAVEWSGPIPIPSDLLATVCFKVYASFEFQPMLGAGEQLQTLAVTVEQLLDHSTRVVLFALLPKDGDVVSSCSSISIAVQRRKCKSSGLSVPNDLGPRRSSTESQGELEDATNYGHCALSRFRKHGEKKDLRLSVEAFERALDICPLDHPCRAAAQSNLATAKFIFCRVDDVGSSLNLPLGLYRDALAARPVGHPDRPSTLIHLAAVHLVRFEWQRDEVDVARAESLLDEALELGSTESHENQAAAFMLQMHARCKANAIQEDGQSVDQDSASGLTYEDLWISSLWLLERFERSGDLNDLQQVIAILRELIKTTPVRDERHHAELANLGVALFYRFRHLGHLTDLEESISTLRTAVDLTPCGHPDKPTYLNSLGSSFRARFNRLREMSNLEDAISSIREAVDLAPLDHPSRPVYLGSLGTSLLSRFKHLGEFNDLEDAISRHRDAVDITPHGHPSKPLRLSNLGSSFLARFERLGEPSNLEDGISTLGEAIELTPLGHPNKPVYLNNLGNTFLTRFRLLGKRSDLTDAISTLTDAIDLTPRNHPNKPAFLNNLSSSLNARFGCLGDLISLDDAISTLKEAVDLTPSGHPDLPVYLNSLGNSFFTRFKHVGELSDLEHAISKHRDAVDLTPRDHPDRSIRLNSLGNSFLTRFERFGELIDLQNAISTLKEAVDLTPPDHPDRPLRLNNLGNTFLTRFKHLGELSDLEDAISRHRDAIDLTPPGHPNRPGYLNNFGSSLGARFKCLGDLASLEGAISTLREAVDLTPPGQPDKPNYLNSLGTSFFTRFRHLGESSDLEDAISSHRVAVDLTPYGHPGKPLRLSNLGNSLLGRFNCLGEPADLEDAISRHREAADLTPPGHPQRPSHLSNLGNTLVARFQRLGRLSDLEDAISRHRDAVDFTPPGHPDKPACLNNLGSSFKVRFEHIGEPSDLEDAISMLRDAADLTPTGHPDKPGWLSNLASSIAMRFERFGELSDLEQAMFLYSHAASASIGPISARFRASQEWISCARRFRHDSLLHAYSVAIDLLPQLAWIGFALTRRYSGLRQGANVVREAAAAALDSGLLEIAVEWLEQGRSIVWGDLFHLRSSHQELSSHPDHARRLRQLSAALEHAATAREKVLSAAESATDDATESLQQEADRYRALAIERDKLLREIRRLPGLERFLLKKTFSQLRASAHSGPVVILNATETRCDALIVLADVDHVLHVPLPAFPFNRSEGLQNMLEKLLGHACVIRCDDREGGRATRGCVSWESLLSTLWNGAVKPVMDALGFPVPEALENPPRIFWCPTGPFVFLPIHAAGLYDSQHSEPGHKVTDFVVSSYVPTLAILAMSPTRSVRPDNGLRLLAVRQPSSDGLSPLPGVTTELSHIREIIRKSGSGHTALVESSAGTVEEVLGLMKEADWVHFACHGIQDGADSGLCLAAGRRLKLRDKIGLSRPRGGLAFLSACQTAQGDKGLSDEAIHIAAGMLFAGYGGVVGTMWSISDKVAPEVARDVYEQLFRGGAGARPDYRGAAGALHGAIGRLRSGGKASFVSWLPFIHVGL